MINLNFNIRNPWSKRFFIMKSWHGTAWIEHKYWEFNIYKTADIVGFHFDLGLRQDHAGLSISLDLLGHSVHFEFYDNRHWDNDRDYWEITQ